MDLKKVLISLILTVVITAIFIVIYRDNIFQNIQDPGQPFQTYERPKAPNYVSPEAWLSLPDKHWNLPSDDLRRKSKLERIVRPNYVTPYADAGRLFTPFYRQASLYAYMTQREDALMAQDLAYSDVRRAFEVFLSNSPRLAVAYIIDFPLPKSALEGPLQGIPICETANQFGCIVAFGAFAPNEKKIAERFGTRLMAHNGQNYSSVADKALICVNPLLWTQSEDYAPARLHKGGVAAEGLDPDMRPAPLDKQVGAQCQDGLLLTDKPRSRSLRRPLKVGGKFRTLPSNLFYEDLRLNSIQRVENLIEANILPRRAKLLEDYEVLEIEEAPVGDIIDVDKL